MIPHLLLTVLTNFSRNVTLNVLSRATVGYLLFFALEQLGGSLQRRNMTVENNNAIMNFVPNFMYPVINCSRVSGGVP
jgi:hypothetical protein